MADSVKTQTLQDDDLYYVAKFTNFCDGTGESLVKKIDASALSPPCRSLTIEEIWYSTHEMAVHLYWDCTANLLILSVPKDRSDHLDFRAIGGLSMSMGGSDTGFTGDILFSTSDATGNDTYTIILKCRKNNP